MTDLALEYCDRNPHFIMGKGAAHMWATDDHNIVACFKHPAVGEEEWCKLYKEWDVWWLIRRNEEKRDMSSVLKLEDMNNLDAALSTYLAQKELLE